MRCPLSTEGKDNHEHEGRQAPSILPKSKVKGSRRYLGGTQVKSAPRGTRMGAYGASTAFLSAIVFAFARCGAVQRLESGELAEHGTEASRARDELE